MAAWLPGSWSHPGSLARPPPATLQCPWLGLVPAGSLPPPTIPCFCTSASSSSHCVPLSEVGRAYGCSPDTWDVGNRPISGYLVVLRVLAGFLVTPHDSRQQIPQTSPQLTCRPVAPSPSTRSTCDREWVGLSASFRPTAPPACVWAEGWHGAFQCRPSPLSWCVQ